MKNLLNQTDCNELITRINKLASGTQPQWGKMNVAQMLTHTHRTLQSASGELKLKRSFIGVLFGGIAKKKLLSDEPWKHSMPTDKHFVVADRGNFDEAKKAVLAAVQSFVNAGPNGVAKDPHPFFGNLTAEEWGRLMWTHLNHHLNQFGV